MNNDTTVPTETADIPAGIVDKTQNLLQGPSSSRRTLYIALGIGVLLVVGFIYFSYSNAVSQSAVNYPTEGGIIVENGVSTFSGLIVAVEDGIFVEIAPGDVDYGPDLNPRFIPFSRDTQIIKEGGPEGVINFPFMGLRVGEIVLITVIGDISAQKTFTAGTITVQPY